jgi:hypothetical protein
VSSAFSGPQITIIRDKNIRFPFINSPKRKNPPPKTIKTIKSDALATQCPPFKNGPGFFLPIDLLPFGQNLRRQRVLVKLGVYQLYHAEKMLILWPFIGISWEFVS